MGGGADRAVEGKSRGRWGSVEGALIWSKAPLNRSVDGAQLVQGLPSKQEVLGSVPSTAQLVWRFIPVILALGGAGDHVSKAILGYTLSCKQAFYT